MNLSARFSACVLLALLPACSTISSISTPLNVRMDYDKNGHFETYKTYAWAPLPKTQTLASPAIDQAIRAAVEKKLAARGLVKAEGKAPDVYAIYHLTSPQTTDVRFYTDWGFSGHYQPGNGYYLGWPGQPVTYTTLVKEKAGAMILDLVEVRRQQLVWRGVASGVVQPNGQDAGRIDTAVDALLAKYPPPAAK